MEQLSESDLSAMVATLNAMSVSARAAVLSTMSPGMVARLHAAGAQPAAAAASSTQVRDARLADIAAMDANRKGALWAEAATCAQQFEAALMSKGFHDCGDKLSHWRTTFRDTHAVLVKMKDDADGLASRGMPALDVDAEAVRASRKQLGKLVDADVAQIELLLKACDQLSVLFATLGLFQPTTKPLSAAPSL